MRTRLFEVEDAQVLESLAYLDGVMNGECPVHVDQNIDVVAHGLSHLGDGVDCLVGWVVNGPGHGAVQLVAAIALLDERGGPPRLLQGRQIPVHGAGIHAHLVAHPTAQQFPDRLVHGLALDVPQGDVQPGDGAPDGAAHLQAAAGAFHIPEAGLGLRRVFTHQCRC